jgi:DNA-binding transcriptional regulator YhcF (GntR family)
MEIRINKKSGIPIRRQLVEQIIFSIATEQLEPGEFLPSVRELARRLKIHRNTISQAYRDLERRGWLVGKRGSRVTIRARGSRTHAAAIRDLDDLLNATIHMAREHGYTLTKLTECVERRLELAPLIAF